MTTIIWIMVFKYSSYKQMSEMLKKFVWVMLLNIGKITKFSDTNL